MTKTALGVEEVIDGKKARMKNIFNVVIESNMQGGEEERICS